MAREFEAARLRAVDQYKRDLTLAWHIGKCTALARSKKGLPALDDMLKGVNQGSDGRMQSPEAMLASVQMLSHMHGIPMRRKRE